MRGLDVIGVPTARIQEVLQSPGFAFFPAIQEMSTFTSGVTGTTVTANAVPHASGIWVELITATTLAASSLLVTVGDTSASSTDTRCLLDIGFGAAASEVAVVSSIPAGFASALTSAAMAPAAFVPINIPVGTRISARLQSLVTVKTANVVVATAAGQRVGIRPPSTVDTIGADTANSRGTNMPTSNTYVQLTAATTQAYRGLVVLPCGGAATVFATEAVTYTLAVGASGSEVAVGTALVKTNSVEILFAGFGFPSVFAGHFPKGTRVACKQSVGTNYRDVVVLGIPYS